MPVHVRVCAAQDESNGTFTGGGEPLPGTSSRSGRLDLKMGDTDSSRSDTVCEMTQTAAQSALEDDVDGDPNAVCELADGGVTCLRNHGCALIRKHSLADTFQVLDLGRLSRLHRAFVGAMPRVRPHYAVKCNPHGGLLRAVAGLGCGFDCASAAEIRQALATGVQPADIIFAHTCKLPGDIRFAASMGIHTMTFDCEDELDKVAALCPAARLVLRIRADDPTAIVQLGEKFGADADAEAPALLAAARRRGLAVDGVSFHVGSGSQDPQAFRRAVEAARRTFDAAAALGIHLNILDIGGGFRGTFDANGDVVLSEVAAAVNEGLTRCFPHEQFPGLEVIAEPGRYFAETCMTLFAVVHTVKSRPDGGGLYYISDGLHGSFAECDKGCRFVRAHIVRSPDLPAPPDAYTASRRRSTVYGPTCDGGDRILEEVPMPVLRRGDWLQFPEHGAYGTSMASTFNGFAAADAATFYVWSKAAVDPRQCAVHALHRGSVAGCPGWQAPEELLCLTASPEDLGIHIARAAGTRNCSEAGVV